MTVIPELDAITAAFPSPLRMADELLVDYLGAFAEKLTALSHGKFFSYEIAVLFIFFLIFRLLRNTIFKNNFFGGDVVIDLLKEKWFVEIVAISLSVISTIISIRSLKISKTQTINSAITKNRIDWIGDVRDLVQQFIAEYLKDDIADPYMKRVLATKIKLYLRNNSNSYKVFIKNLDRCTMNKFNEGDYQLLVVATQDMLNSVWVRMKREAGINSRDEERIAKRLAKGK